MQNQNSTPIKSGSNINPDQIGIKDQPRLNQGQKQESNSPASSMAQLLASYKTPFVAPQKGEILKGKITKLTPSEILVDINAKTEAVVLEKDKKILNTILAHLKVGDEVSVSVLNPESDNGNPVVSLRRFIGDISWEKLIDAKKNKKEVEVFVTETTRGGFLVTTTGGQAGFLPNSHMLPNTGQELIGKKIKVFVLELNREERKIIFSQKVVLGAEDFEKAIKSLKVEQKITAVVSNITPFGIFVTIQSPDVQAVDGLIHISEISWEKVESISNLYSQGQSLEAVVIGFDKDAKRVDLSLKRLTQDPFGEILKDFAVDKKVSGEVIKIVPTGVILKLTSKSGQEVEGLIRKEKIPPTVSYKVGDEVKAIVSQVDARKHRIVLVPVLLEKPIGYR
ncbi:S1 RNA-binding domain-containing protein [Candidatus Microgenomates bacterium]|nr:MAG: S1 RNA-binding domain-containing protein [Candidatus Microgenomates bacterium]